jgi:uncharacterized protein YkwD
MEATMRRGLLTSALALSLMVAGCGGSDETADKAPTPAPKANSGGTVTAEATKGLLGPASTAEENAEKVTGKLGPISPDADQPTEAQRNGVAGGVACAASAASANPTGRNLRSVMSSTVCLLNAERASKGLRPLRSNGRLKRASRLMANLMVRRQFFAHDTPDGRSLADRVRPTGYMKGSWSIGENLAWGSGALATPRSIVNGWMNSPGHRANILQGKFKHIGIAVKIGAPQRGLSGGATYVTVFGKNG